MERTTAHNNMMSSYATGPETTSHNRGRIALSSDHTNMGALDATSYLL